MSSLIKALIGLCGAIVVLYMTIVGVQFLYAANSPSSHEGEKQGYVIASKEESGDAQAEAPQAEAPVDVASILAAGDAANGERVFNKNCKACHKTAEGANGVGPSLYSVVNRPVDSAEGYSYSGALEKVVDTWTPENIFTFVENPRGFAPGTKMTFKGVSKPADRADLVAYLQTIGN